MSNKKAAIKGAFLPKIQSEDKLIVPEVDLQVTDIDRWRLLDERGQQTWHYLETDVEVKAWPQSLADRYHLGLPIVRSHAVKKLYSPELEILTVFARTFQICRKPERQSNQSTMLSLSFLNYSCHQAIGRATMGGPCSSFQVWSLPGMSRTHQYRILLQSR